MEVILIIVFGLVILGLFIRFLDYLDNLDNKSNTQGQIRTEITSTQDAKETSVSVQKPTIRSVPAHVERARTGELLERLNDDQIRAIRQIVKNYYEVHHVHHHHVHVTHEVRHKNSSEEDKDHTAAVWERLGYQVKAGETYSYKFYGREIFKPHQVERAGQYRNRIAKSGLSENQLKVKTLGLALVEKTGSKRAAKDILVEDYGFNENTAKYAVGYRGYDDY